MNLEFEQQLEVFEANLRAAKQQNDLNIATGRFRVDVARAWSQIRTEQVRLLIEWNKARQEVIKAQIENAKSFLELQVRQKAFRDFKYWQRRETIEFQKKQKETQKLTRFTEGAARVFQGQAMPSKFVVSTWRNLGRLALRLRSTVVFPETKRSECFIRIRLNADRRPEPIPTPKMTISELAQFCRKKSFVVDTKSNHFDSITEFWNQAALEIQKDFEKIESETAEVRERLAALNAQQWTTIF